MIAIYNRKKLLENLDIIMVIEDHINLFQRDNNNYFSHCPFHEESSPSFIVMPFKKKFKCFGCGAEGDVVDFIMAYKKMNLCEALVFIAIEYKTWCFENKN